MGTKPTWVVGTVTSIRDLTPTVREMTLTMPVPAPLFVPGSHIQIKAVAGGRTIVRHYSLIGMDADRLTWRIAVRREDAGRGGSLYMWSLKPGSRLPVSGPHCNFELSNVATERLLVAGGIGITPLIGMADSLVRRRLPFRLLYAGRSRREMPYVDELQQICGASLDIVAEDEHGRPDLGASILSLSEDAEAYVCGPPGLLEAMRHQWLSAGRARTRLIFESFGNAGKFPAAPFRVHLPRLGLQVEIPEDLSILEALENAGVGVLYNCRMGECGLCQMDVLSVDGNIDHRDVYFSDAQHSENHKLCACVSRVTASGSVCLEPAWRGDVPLRSGRELAANS